VINVDVLQRVHETISNIPLLLIFLACIYVSICVHRNSNTGSFSYCNRQGHVEEHCSENGLPECKDIVFRPVARGGAGRAMPPHQMIWPLHQTLQILAESREVPADVSIEALGLLAK